MILEACQILDYDEDGIPYMVVMVMMIMMIMMVVMVLMMMMMGIVVNQSIIYFSKQPLGIFQSRKADRATVKFV